MRHGSGSKKCEPVNGTGRGWHAMKEGIWTREGVAAGYDLVAAGFLHGPVYLDCAKQAEWYDRFDQNALLLKETWQTLMGSLEGDRAKEEAVRDFHQCLEVPVPGLYVPPYASCYLDRPAVLWGPSTRQVLTWYEQGGLEWQAFRHIVAPDHAGVEWAFLAELNSDPSPEVFPIQILITDHIQKWFPLFLSHLEKAVESPYYPALARWGLAWITANHRIVETDNEILS